MMWPLILGVAAAAREEVNFDFAWRHQIGDPKQQAGLPAAAATDFDDSGWEIGSERAGWGSAGTGTIEDAVVDAIVGKMMWTSDYDGHNDVFCRIVHDHKPPNCKDAADRYAQDYPEIMQQREARMLAS